MDYGALTKKLVADAIMNKLSGLTVSPDFVLFVSAGSYDVETDTTTSVTTTIPKVKCVAVKPTFEDVTNLDVKASDKKLLVPGTSLPSEPQPDTDKVILDGATWNISKVVGVPGGSLYSVFINRT